MGVRRTLAPKRTVRTLADSVVRRLRFARREVDLRSLLFHSSRRLTADPNGIHSRQHRHGLFASHGSRRAKSTRTLTSLDFRLRYDQDFALLSARLESAAIDTIRRLAVTPFARSLRALPDAQM